MGDALGPVGLGLSVGGSLMSAGSQYAQGRAQENYYRASARNAVFRSLLSQQAAENQISYDAEAAASQISAVRRDGEELFGSQLAVMAANGMDLSSQSAQDIVAASLNSQQRDIDNLQLNQNRRAYEIRRDAKLGVIDAMNQSSQYRAAGRGARYAGTIGAFSSLLSTAGQVASLWRPSVKTGNVAQTNPEGWAGIKGVNGKLKTKTLSNGGNWIIGF